MSDSDLSTDIAVAWFAAYAEACFEAEAQALAAPVIDPLEDRLAHL